MYMYIYMYMYNLVQNPILAGHRQGFSLRPFYVNSYLGVLYLALAVSDVSSMFT